MLGIGRLIAGILLLALILFAPSMSFANPSIRFKPALISKFTLAGSNGGNDIPKDFILSPAFVILCNAINDSVGMLFRQESVLSMYW